MWRRLIGTALWILAIGVTSAIVWYGMGTQDWIITAIGAIGIIAAGTGIFLAMDAARDGAGWALMLCICLWLLGEAFIIPAEVNYWSARVTAKAEREMDLARQDNGRRLILDTTADQLTKGKPARTSAVIQANIDQELARSYGNQTLSGLTNGCTDLSSRYIRLCRQVLALKGELAVAVQHEQASRLVWDANTALGADTASAHGAHDGPMRLANMLGGTPAFWSNAIIAITVLLLFFVRGIGLFLGWRPDRTNRKAIATPMPLAPAATPIGTAKTALPIPLVHPAEETIAKPHPLAPAQVSAFFDTNTLEEMTQTVCRTYEREGRGEVAMPIIRADVRTLANGRGRNVNPSAQRLGTILTEVLRYPSRRGTPAEGRTMIYNFDRKGVAKQPHKEAA